MSRVNSQREKEPKERENGLKPGNGGQQLKTEKPFVSRGLSREATARETVAAIDSWRRERDSDSRYNRCLRGAVACPTAPPNPGSASRCSDADRKPLSAPRGTKRKVSPAHVRVTRQRLRSRFNHYEIRSPNDELRSITRATRRDGSGFRPSQDCHSPTVTL